MKLKKSYSLINELKNKSQIAKIPFVDLLLMSLNSSGVNTNNNRIRFRFKITPIKSKKTYFFDSFKNQKSPFSIVNNLLILEEEVVAKLENIEVDNVVLGYFRNQGKELTINSNSRSFCVGCVFCYTTLEKASDPKLTDRELLSDYFEYLIAQNDSKTISNLEGICLCTGCFSNEDKLIEHIINVYQIASKYGFHGTLKYLGSEITRLESLKTIVKTINKFQYIYSIDCFERRELILKSTKSKNSLNGIKEILKTCAKLNIKTNYTYILGLDSLDNFREHIAELKNLISAFPIFQIYQPHTRFMEVFKNERFDLDYLIKTRKIIEEVYNKEHLEPKSWENYRSIWYETFNNKLKIENSI